MRYYVLEWIDGDAGRFCSLTILANSWRGAVLRARDELGLGNRRLRIESRGVYGGVEIRNYTDGLFTFGLREV